VKDRNQPYLDAFGEHLKKLMDSKGLTPDDIAAGGRIEPKQVYRVINAEHSATLTILYSIAKGLEVHPRNLFDFEFKEKK
jgi:transcriptional regulator with XRE-family HTH domain